MKLTTRNDSVHSLEGQLSESRKRFSAAQEEISRLEEQARELNLEMSMMKVQQERIEHNVSVYLFCLLTDLRGSINW